MSFLEKLKLKLGDIVVLERHGGELGVIDDAGVPKVGVIIIGSQRRVFCYRSELEPYTGPVYERDGQRFVPSGEFRRPKEGEWFLSHKATIRRSGYELSTAPSFEKSYFPILLPVPELESEAASFLKGTREIRDKDLWSNSTLLLRCKSECCIPRKGRLISQDMINGKGELNPWIEGRLCFKFSNNGEVLFLHTGNRAPFATMRTIYKGGEDSTGMITRSSEWEVEWLIPKEDIRVVL